MAALMQVELVAPDAVIYSGEASMVIVRTDGGGEVAFLAHHAPFLAALADHEARIFLDDGTVRHVLVHGGFVQVAHNKVSILSDASEFV